MEASTTATAPQGVTTVLPDEQRGRGQKDAPYQTHTRESRARGATASLRGKPAAVPAAGHLVDGAKAIQTRTWHEGAGRSPKTQLYTIPEGDEEAPGLWADSRSPFHTTSTFDAV